MKTLNKIENNRNNGNDMKKILHLTLKKKWFDMIASGVKKEEYREEKLFWASRLMGLASGKFKVFDEVHFYNGGYCSYSLPFMRVEFDGMCIDEGNPEWGAEPGVEYFVIGLGPVLEINRHE